MWDESPVILFVVASLAAAVWDEGKGGRWGQAHEEGSEADPAVLNWVQAET